MTTKVLCLHGCNQTEEMFRSILKSMVKIGTKSHDLEFHFLQAKYPHSLGGWTWYSRELDVYEIPAGISYSSELTKECMNEIDHYITENDITVLLGFSQGGNAVDTYLRHIDTEAENRQIKRALIFSGYELDTDNTKKLDVPLLSIYSDDDTVVPSKCRPSNYTTLHEYKHAKGHKFPTGNQLLRRFCAFIQNGAWACTEIVS